MRLPMYSLFLGRFPGLVALAMFAWRSTPRRRDDALRHRQRKAAMAKAASAQAIAEIAASLKEYQAARASVGTRTAAIGASISEKRKGARTSGANGRPSC